MCLEEWVCVCCPSVCVWCVQEALRRVADNGLKQYVRSRPAPSLDSVRRAKELQTPPVHPMFSEWEGRGGGWRVGEGRGGGWRVGEGRGGEERMEGEGKV